MRDSTPIQAERVGAGFSVDGMLVTRQKTRAAIDTIASKVKPGMVEEDAVAMAKQVLIDAGLALSWHPVRVRFGANTMKPMKQESTPGVILKKDDIFFIDIAPRHELWEGDGGKTFTVGHSLELARCARDAEALFHDVREAWRREELTGQELYKYADMRAKTMGWSLNFDLPGHRISDFPHAAIYTGPLADADFHPAAMRWILEIHIRDKMGRFGAFFEDLLLDDEFYS